MLKTKVITRNDYINGKATHREYHAQFVGDKLKKLVLNRIGIDKIKASKDEHMNDIPLRLWDSIAGATTRGASVVWFNPGAIVPYMEITFKEAGEGYSLAGAVCVLKEAAKQIKENK